MSKFQILVCRFGKPPASLRGNHFTKVTRGFTSCKTLNIPSHMALMSGSGETSTHLAL